MDGHRTGRVVGGVLLALVLAGVAAAGPGASHGVARAAARPSVSRHWWLGGTGDRGIERSRRPLQFTLIDGTTYGPGCIDACATLWP